MKHLLLLVLSISWVACGPKNSPPAVEQLTSTEAIIGNLDWTSIRSNGQSKENQEAKKVGLLHLSGSRCTGFLISEDLVMTNYHCVSSQDDVFGSSINFNYEEGSRGHHYSCYEYVYGNESLDFAIIRCDGKPGSTRGHVTLSQKEVTWNDQIFVIHQNCNYNDRGDCLPTKKISRGKILGTYESSLYHDADTLGGSSGSPLFDSESGEVIGLHNSGVNVNESGQGAYNGGISMKAIRAHLESRRPDVLVKEEIPELSLSWETQGNWDLEANQYKFSLELKGSDREVSQIQSIDLKFVGSEHTSAKSAPPYKWSFKSTQGNWSGTAVITLKGGAVISKDFTLAAVKPYQLANKDIDLAYQVKYRHSDQRNIYSLSLKVHDSAYAHIAEVSYKLTDSNKYPNALVSKSATNFFSQVVESRRGEYEVNMVVTMKNGATHYKSFVIQAPESQVAIDASDFEVELYLGRPMLMQNGRYYLPFQMRLDASKDVMSKVTKVVYDLRQGDGEELKSVAIDKSRKFSSKDFYTSYLNWQVYKVQVYLKSGKVVDLVGPVIHY